jgi:nucleoside-diphosphate-sugar epimerase
MVTGALGQIGSELTQNLRKIYGVDNVLCTNIDRQEMDVVNQGPFEILDVKDGKRMSELVRNNKIDTIIHLAAILSGVGEKNPKLAWEVNMYGLYNVLEVAREEKCAVFTPSSIAAFGDTTPFDNTPQDTIQRPSTMYGVTKVAGENLSDYYHMKYGVDTRGVRYPGIISHTTLPGGGTTDYAVHIYYEALKTGKFSCPIAKGTFMDMMYMPDALDAIVQLMEADGSKLKHRNAFNISAMSFDPEIIAAEIKKHIPKFEMTYDVNEVLQKIAMSWPNKMDDSAAREEWNWKPTYDLDKMTRDMLMNLQKRGIGSIK